MKIAAPYGFFSTVSEGWRYGVARCESPEVAADDAPLALIFRDPVAPRTAPKSEVRIINGVPYEWAHQQNTTDRAMTKTGALKLNPMIFLRNTTEAAVDINSATHGKGSGIAPVPGDGHEEVEEKVRNYCANDLRLIDGKLYVKCSMPVFILWQQQHRNGLQFSVKMTRSETVEDECWPRTFLITDLNAATAEKDRLNAEHGSRDSTAAYLATPGEADFQVIDERLCMAATPLAEKLLIAALIKAKQAFSGWLPFTKNDEVIDLYDDLRCRIASIGDSSAAPDAQADRDLLAHACSMLSESVKSRDLAWAGDDFDQIWAAHHSTLQALKARARMEEKARSSAAETLAGLQERIESLTADAQLSHLAF